ncbi:MAG: Peptidase S9 prolyl oligopeptidase active site domain protein [Candidatus Moranbacteria bacterium GW2011_GWC2_45_10]|nr:MAG: Peptidase S9 prolyl oligopeptidase active site domain protein [Candidatus Moranbacteria bacterium GW2011_GWC2_45_10]
MTKKTIYSLSGIILLSAAFFGTYYLLNRKEPETKTFPAPISIEDEIEGEEVKKPHPDTIPAMSQKEFQGNDLKLGRILDENESYTRYHITYKSEGFTISGIMNVPKGEGPFPILVLNHGYIDPKVYTNGQGLKREQDFFARNGYVVLHSDYRSHAQSDFDPANEVRPRSGYVEDVLNAVSALEKSNFAFVDKENIGMLGHSMGGGITTNVMVTKPDAAKAFVLLAPIHADYEKNFDRWVKTTWPETAQEFYDTYGTKEDNPDFWRDISAINFISNVKAPVMLHQGTADAEFPYTWAHDLVDAFEKNSREITYHEYPGEGHIFYGAQPIAMQRTLEFFDDNLKK